MAGDCHGNSTHVMNVVAHAKRADADAIIQLGDLGYGWRWGQRKITGEHFDEFTGNVSKFTKAAGIPFYWIDGNHENFNALEDLMEILPVQPDGTYEIEENVFYIPRGTVMCWDGKTFLCCGGACSIDQKMRTEHVSWWPQELITQKDIDKCAEAGKVDVVLTHDFPSNATSSTGISIRIGARLRNAKRSPTARTFRPFWRPRGRRTCAWPSAHLLLGDH